MIHGQHSPMKFPVCDPSSLPQRLATDSDLERLALEEHLAVCSQCRAELDAISGGSEWVLEVRKHLSSSVIRAFGPSADEDSLGGASDREVRGFFVEDSDAGDKLDFLEPSEDVSKLGRLGVYEIERIIGRGGMGIVLKAFDAALNRPVAIKVLAAQLATSGTARRRFSREAQAAAAVVHEHVVAIHAVDTSTALPFLVMPYIPGRSLQERLDASGPLDVKEILRISIQTALGLAAAHAQGLVHRDIKPANILLENGVERVLISDFGLARAVDDASQTQSGFIAGTPQYMAPEQARGEQVDHRADLFSLGSVMYAMCSGHPPFRAETTLAVLRRICEESPRCLREINPEIPAWLEAVIQKLHARDPNDRFQSATEVATLLQRYLAHLQQPLVHPMPDFHLPQSGQSKRRSVDWRRAALWSVPVSLTIVITLLVAFSEFLMEPGRSSSQPASVSTASISFSGSSPPGGAGMFFGSPGKPSTPDWRPRDPWPAWETALSSLDESLVKLESELSAPTKEIPELSAHEAIEDLDRQLDILELELRRR